MSAMLGKLGDGSFNGMTLAFRSFAFQVKDLHRVLLALDPSTVNIGLGEGSIFVPTDADDDDMKSLMSVAANKTLNVVMWLSMTTGQREFAFVVTRGANVASETEIAKVLQEKEAILAVYMSSYVLHGSHERLAASPALAANFPVVATGITAQQLTWQSVCDFKQMAKAKYPGMVCNFFQLITGAPATFISRVKKGTAGNRPFSIISLLISVVGKVNPKNETLKIMASDAVLKAAPFISFHPDHPMNPFGDTGKNVMRAIGQLIRESGTTVAALKLLQPKLIINGVALVLEEKFNGSTMNLPSIEALKKALQPKYAAGATSFC